MSDETNRNDGNTSPAPAEPQRPALDSGKIDMAEFEVSFAGPCAHEPADGERRYPAVPVQRRSPVEPAVEWAVLWASGQVTQTGSEESARLIEKHNPQCRVARRVVGPWRVT